MKRCYGCMKMYDESKFMVCPNCGYSSEDSIGELVHLAPGTVLHNQYSVGKVLGYGGFGVTYLGWDGQLEREVAIKEYMPSEFSTRMPGNTQLTFFGGDKDEQFGDGKRKFLDEARRLAECGRNKPGIVEVYDSFEENDTAYIVMEYLDGETLADYLKHAHTIAEDDAVELLMPVMRSLEELHALTRTDPETGEEENVPLLHRDISPDNIFITKKGDVKLIDFGAARYATTSHSRSLTVLVKPGYSPEEQYRSRGDQGKYTDVYSLAATLYKMITGETPPDAMERRAMYENRNKDILEEPHKYKRNISRAREVAILNAMNVEIEKRTPDIATFIKELESDPPAKRVYGKIRKIDLYNWPTWLKVAVPCVAAALLVLVGLFATGVIRLDGKNAGRITIPDGIVQVPNVLNSSKEEATGKLEEAGLIVTYGEGEKTSYVEEGLVVLQNPIGGYYAEYSSTVTIHTAYSDEVAAAQNGVAKIPYVIGNTYEDAKERIEAAGLSCALELVPDEYMEEGLVCGIIRNGVKALEGEELSEGTQLILQVSTGPKSFEMPDVVGLTFDEARTILKDKGITVIQSNVNSTEYEEGYVAEQSLEPGEKVKKGDSVTLGVVASNGGELITVPNVVNMKQKDADKELTDYGFKVNVLVNKDKNIEKGYIISQNPSSGTKQNKGSTITIIVSGGYDEKDESVDLDTMGIKATPTPTVTPTPTPEPTPTQKPVSKYTLTFDANGGTASVSSKSLEEGEEYGSLPSATKSFCSFAGWYTRSGSRVSETTVMGNSDVTVYAKWDENTESGWVKASEVPSGAMITDEKWVYNEVSWITSDKSSVPGYILDESKTQSSSSDSWGGWSDWTTNPVSGSSTREVETRTERVDNGQRPVSYDLVEHNYMGNNGKRYYRIDDIGGDYASHGYSKSYGKFTRYITLDAGQLNSCPTVGSGGFMGGANGGYNDCGETGYVVDHPEIPGTIIMFVYNVNYETTYADVTYYRYRDKATSTAYTYYLYKKESKESRSEVSESDNISDVEHYVKYISK